MSSKPPFDMIDDQIAVAALARDGRDDVVDLRDVAGVDAGRLQIGDELLGRQPLGVGQRRAEHRRQDHVIGRRQRPREVGLEDAPAGRRGARLEDRPDPAVRDTPSARRPASRRSRSGGARSRRRPRRPRRCRAARSRRRTPLNAAQRRPPSCRCSARPPRRRRSPRARCARCRRRAAAARSVPIGVAAAPHAERGRRAVDLADRAPASRRRRDRPNVSTRQCARSRERQRLGVVGAEQQQAAPRDQVDEALERQPDRRRGRDRCRRDRTRCC